MAADQGGLGGHGAISAADRHLTRGPSHLLRLRAGGSRLSLCGVVIG